MILGLDVSTSKTGWCMLNDDATLHKMGCVVHGEGTLFDRVAVLIDSLRHETSGSTDLHVAIEEPLLSFARGMSSASTLLTLNRYNGMVTYACWRDLGVQPIHLNVIFARRNLGIKKQKGDNVKEVVMDWVAQQVKGYTWPTKVISRGKRAGEVVFEPICYDVADAYVMARAAHAGRVK